MHIFEFHDVQFLADCFKVNPLVHICRSIAEVVSQFTDLQEQRAALAYFGYWLPEWAFLLAMVWDAMVLTTAIKAGASVLWSEDLNHGQSYDGIVVRNPFRGDS